MTILLSTVILVLLFVVLVYVAHASELAMVLNGEDKDTTKASRRNGYASLLFLIGFFVAVAWSCKEYLPALLPKSASLHGVETDRLYNEGMILMFLVFILTHIALFWFAYRYNESNNKVAYFYPHNNKLEAIWTIIPALVLVAMAVTGMRVWFDIFDVSKRDTKNMMVLEVTAKQFQWTVRYSGKDNAFGERIIDKEHVSPENELGINWKDAKSHDDFFADKIYLVKNKPVLVKLGAQDVLHSFFLPHFRVKLDCIPGLPTQFYFVPTLTTKEMQEYLSTQPWWQQVNPETGKQKWETFKYELACTEICGRSHYGMQKDVVVVEQKEYDEWMNKQDSYYKTVVQPTLVGNNNIPADKVQALN